MRGSNIEKSSESMLTKKDVSETDSPTSQRHIRRKDSPLRSNSGRLVPRLKVLASS